MEPAGRLRLPSQLHGKAKRRVLTLVDRLGAFGGGERLAMEVTMRLDSSRFERSLCLSRVPASPEDVEDALAGEAELQAAGVSVLRLDRASTAGLASWRHLAYTLRKERIEVLHAHKFGSNVWGTIIGRLARVPVMVAHEHTWSYEGQPVRRFLDRHLIARGSDAFVAVSREDRRRMIEIEGIDPSDIVFLPNGIPSLPPPTGNLRRELGIAPHAPVVGVVAVLRRQKAVDVLVRAAASVIEEFPNLRVVIAGDGGERPELERLIEQLGMSHAFSLIGLRSDVPNVLATLDVAISCSNFEGSPLSVMEYMAAGRPVVATRVGGVPDLIEDGVHGRLVERGDHAALASAVTELLRDPGRAQRMGEAGRERQSREFHIDAMVGRVEELYERLLAAR